MSNQTILDATLVQAIRDPAAGPDLHRALTALCAVSGRSYMSEYEGLHRAMLESLHGAEGMTVGDSIRARDDVKLGDVREDLRTLEAAAEASGRVRQHALRALDQLPTDDHGRVRLLDGGGLVDMRPSGTPPRTTPTGTRDAGMAIGPATFEQVANAPLLSSRLHRARQLTGQYQGDEGAKQWRQADLAHAEANIDLLGTMERSHAAVVADQQAQTLAERLDVAFQAGDSPKQRRKLMEKAAAQTLRTLDQDSL